MSKLTQDFRYNVDSRLGQYGFYYDESSGEYKYVFKYWTDPRFGQYVMYYDIIARNAIRYTFNYYVDPTFGAYKFIYNPMENLHIDEEILLKRQSNNGVVITEPGIKVVRERVDKTNTSIDSFSKYIKRLDTDFYIEYKEPKTTKTQEVERVQNITVDDFVSLLFYESLVHDSLSIVDHEFFATDNATLNSYIESNEVEVNANNIRDGRVDSYEKGVNFEERVINDDIASEFFVSTVDVVSKIRDDKVLMDNIQRKIEIQQELITQQQERKIEIQQELELKHHYRNIELDEVLIAKDIPRVLDLEISKDMASTVNRNIFMNEISSEVLLNGLGKLVDIDDIQKKLFKTHIGNKLYIDKKELYVEKGMKDFETEEEQVLGRKSTKSVTIDRGERKLGKISKKFLVDEELIVNKTPKDVFADEEFIVEKSPKNAQLGKGLQASRRDEHKIEEEIEERLDLHKRFWFLESLGKMDYKILPNVDYKYPPNIDIFKNPTFNSKFVYRYTDRFKELGNYRVRLHKKDLTILGQHDVIYMNNYVSDISGIELIMSVEEIDSEKYNYEVEFTISTDIEADYMVIKQPKGFMGNEFVFVATEEFLADSHPIPLGEDLGLREIPVSIPIMVDFMNILLLLWSKRIMAFSGMTGTQAITGMSELVYEWLTLDTSLKAEAIEDYNRCYRWFRWESEKVYNRAKLDPNLKGNRWIEEVIFEMIDYLEMHHFDKMPEWDTVIKMDEHRNIFTDPQYDIPIVLDKFKGIRKRVIEKNKRYN